MISRICSWNFLVLVAGFSIVNMASAETPAEILAGYASAAKAENKAFKDFSAEVGKKFYLTEHTNKKGEKQSCATCHTPNPTKEGKSDVGKVIEPMAVSANSKRFTDPKKVEKWFKRNCKDVYDRECTVEEKGHFVAFMMSAK